MECKIIIDQKCEFYFYYGVFFKDEFIPIGLLIKFFHRELKFEHMHPICTLGCHPFVNLNTLICLYYQIKLNGSEKSLNDEFDNKKFEFYKKVLRTYNVGINLDEIINSLLSNHSNLEEMFYGIILRDADQLRNQASLLIFLITKSYFESELFKEHWKEALATNKEIVVFFLEKDFDQEYFINYKTLNIWEFFLKLKNKGFIYFYGGNSMNMIEKEFRNFISIMKTRYKVSKFIQKFPS